MKGKKRAREDSDSDVAPDDNNEADTQLKAYKRLEPAVRCEAHQGHCFIDRTGSQENHRRLTHGEMTLWAKKIVSTLCFLTRPRTEGPTITVPWGSYHLRPSPLPQFRPWAHETASQREDSANPSSSRYHQR